MNMGDGGWWTVGPRVFDHHLIALVKFDSALTYLEFPSQSACSYPVSIVVSFDTRHPTRPGHHQYTQRSIQVEPIPLGSIYTGRFPL